MGTSVRMASIQLPGTWAGHTSSRSLCLWDRMTTRMRALFRRGRRDNRKASNQGLGRGRGSTSPGFSSHRTQALGQHPRLPWCALRPPFPQRLTVFRPAGYWHPRQELGGWFIWGFLPAHRDFYRGRLSAVPTRTGSSHPTELNFLEVWLIDLVPRFLLLPVISFDSKQLRIGVKIKSKLLNMVCVAQKFI